MRQSQKTKDIPLAIAKLRYRKAVTTRAQRRALKQMTELAYEVKHGITV